MHCLDIGESPTSESVPLIYLPDQEPAMPTIARAYSEYILPVRERERSAFLSIDFIEPYAICVS